MFVCIAALVVWAIAIMWFVLFGQHNSYIETGGDKTRAGFERIIDNTTDKAETLDTEDILKALDSTSLPPELIEEIKQEFREKFGDRIPANVVSKLIAEFEGRFGRLDAEKTDDDVT